MPLVLSGSTGIVTANIADNAVTTAKILDSSISSSKIIDGVVSATDLATGAARTNFGAGAVLQVKQVYTDSMISFTNTGSWANSGIYVDITPSSTNSKILILLTVGSGQSANSFNNAFRVTRSGTVIGGNSNSLYGWIGEDTYLSANATTSSAQYLDSPASTSSLRYELQMICDGNTGYINRAGGGTGSIGNAVGSTQIIVMEIAG